MNMTHFYFFFNDTATTEIYTLSLHDALPILIRPRRTYVAASLVTGCSPTTLDHKSKVRGFGKRLSGPRIFGATPLEDRKSTRLNSSHANISYAVFCLKKNKSLKSFLSTTLLS